MHAFDRSEPALRYLGSHVVDVIISDLRRPGLDGIAFYERVSQLDESLAHRILFLTGDTLNERLSEFLRESSNPYLAKPVMLPELHRALHRLLARPANQQQTLFSPDD